MKSKGGREENKRKLFVDTDASQEGEVKRKGKGMECIVVGEV